MGHRICLLAVAVLLFSFLPLLWSKPPFTVEADLSILRVPEDFSTIQEAINAASSDATILVSNGVYYENVIINKTVMLLGADEHDTVIDGSTHSQGYSSAVGVTILADNVTVNGFTVRNRLSGTIGIRLDHSNDSTVSGNVITMSGDYGILLFHCHGNTVRDNIVSSTGYPDGIFGEGIAILSSDNNTISDNLVTHSNNDGLCIQDGSADNIVFGNTIENGLFAFAMGMGTSSNNTIFHNNIIDFDMPFMTYGNSAPTQNTWSVGGEGNYWGNYAGLDDGSDGRTAGDGVGDTDLPCNWVDSNPLITPVNPIRIFWDNKAFPTPLVSNSTVSAFTFDQANKKVSFVATGPANTTGYFNVSIPKTLLSGPWRIMLNQTDATSKSVRVENQTCTMIFLNYSHSSRNIELIGTYVIPEYPTASIFLLAVLLTLASTISNAKRKRHELPNRLRLLCPKLRLWLL